MAPGDPDEANSGEAASYNLTGVVYDLDGTVVGGATVKALESPAGVVANITQCDYGGGYHFRLAGARAYVLVVTYPDGGDFQSDEIVLTSDRIVDIRRAPPRAPGPSPLVYLGLGTIIGLGSIAGLFLLGGEGVRLAILLVPLLLYSRLKRDKVLDHFLRGRIYEVIRQKPGITFNAIRRDLGIANGSLAYHAYTLQREGFVKSVTEGPYRRFFTMDEPVSRAGVLVSELQKKILDLLTVEPGISQSLIADRLGTSPQSVNYNVSRLIRKGMVRMVGWGWKKQCFASAAGSQT